MLSAADSQMTRSAISRTLTPLGPTKRPLISFHHRHVIAPLVADQVQRHSRLMVIIWASLQLLICGLLRFNETVSHCTALKAEIRDPDGLRKADFLQGRRTELDCCSNFISAARMNQYNFSAAMEFLERLQLPPCAYACQSDTAQTSIARRGCSARLSKLIGVLCSALRIPPLLYSVILAQRERDL